MNLFPATCLVCGKVLGREELLVCEEDRLRVKPIASFPHRCERCDRVLDVALSRGLCYDCYERGKVEGNLEKSRALFVYEGVVRELYQKMKYQGNFLAARELLRIALPHQKLVAGWAEGCDVVTVVPSDWFSLWRRGFSPVIWFWKHFFPSLEEKILSRRFALTKQKMLSREERLRRIRGQFVVKQRERILGRRVLVLDDVYTTGSTLEETARVLRENGALRVMGGVIFRD